ncbi:unnamed protein product [Ascophyllum nodosum]
MAGMEAMSATISPLQKQQHRCCSLLLPELLPQVKAILILDEDGGRVTCKYHDKKEFPNLGAEAMFEHKLFRKTKNVNARSEADVVLMDEVVAVFRGGLDVHLYVVGSAEENELILTAVLDALHETLGILLRGQIDRRSLLENLALVLLAMDELIDAGKILEIDPSAIANRVLMRGADARQPLASELTVQQAIATAREEFIKRMGN